ncbi:MAG: LacI family DNA-binding transcriptional regulator [Marvinbryantia sp.]
MTARSTVSMQSIADELGVSKVTVSKALNGKDGVSDLLKERIMQTAAARGYVLPNYGQRKARTVAIIMSERFAKSDAGNLYMRIYGNIIHQLRLCSYSGVMFAPNVENLDKDVETLEKAGMFDGLILLGLLERKVRERMQQIALPKVYVDVYDETYCSDSVVTENIYSAYELTKYLIQKGHKKIGFVGTLGATTSISDRYLGYQRALMERGLSVKSEWIVSDRDAEGAAIELQLPKELPTAFMCNCDETAFRMVKTLRSHELLVPENVSVVGFDNDIYAKLCEPALTTMEVNAGEIGKMAVKRLEKCMESPEKKYGTVFRIPGSLIQRDSVKELIGE